MNKYLKIGSIVTHCYEFKGMVEFWREALHYQFRNPELAEKDLADEDWAVLTDPEGKGPNLSFQRRERPRDRRSWIHLDLYTGDQEAEAARLLKIGARSYPWRYPPGADYLVLQDPDGNLFCVVQK